ncbi:MAG: hypothetical protein KDI46_03075 [Alphaproteobacteria bacterium]|nr:hypothetical protein [Alphaproteobacteria bacterium]
MSLRRFFYGAIAFAGLSASASAHIPEHNTPRVPGVDVRSLLLEPQNKKPAAQPEQKDKGDIHPLLIANTQGNTVFKITDNLIQRADKALGGNARKMREYLPMLHFSPLYVEPNIKTTDFLKLPEVDLIFYKAWFLAKLDERLEQGTLSVDDPRSRLGNQFALQFLKSDDPSLHQALGIIDAALAKIRKDGRIDPKEVIDFEITLTEARGPTGLYGADTSVAVRHLLKKHGIEPTPERVNALTENIEASALFSRSPKKQTERGLRHYYSQTMSGPEPLVDDFLNSLAPTRPGFVFQEKTGPSQCRETAQRYCL